MTQVQCIYNRSPFYFNLYDHLNEGLFCDCCLEVDGQIIKAHRLVLSSASSYFKSVFTNFDEHPTLVLDDITANTFYHILRYIYEGNVLLEEHELGVFINGLACYNIESPTVIGSKQVLDPNDQQVIPQVSIVQPRPKKREAPEDVENIPPIHHVPTFHLDDEGFDDSLFKVKPEKRFKRNLMTDDKPDEQLTSKSPGLKDLKSNTGSHSQIRRNEASSNHSATTTYGIHTCTFCKKSFNLRQSCKRHESSCKMNDDRKRIFCPVCGLNLSSKTTLNSHIKRLHGGVN